MINEDSYYDFGVEIPFDGLDLNALKGGESGDYAKNIVLSLDNDYILSVQLKNDKDQLIGTKQSVDLPLESMVVNGTYNNETKKIELTLQNGNKVEFSVADLVDGLTSKSYVDQRFEETNNLIINAINEIDEL